MRLTLCLEGNGEGRVLASIDMEEIIGHINLKDTIREIHDNVAQEMYCKGIDDMVHKIKERQYVLHILSDFMNCEDYGMFTVGIEQIAEELKAGGKNEQIKFRNI